MKHWGRFICCGLLLVATAGCPWDDDGGDDHHDDEEITVADYADFDSGGTWHFHGTDSGNSLTLTYEGTQTVSGRSVVVLEDDGGRRMYFDPDLSDKLYLVGTSDDGFYDEALPLLRSSFEEGKSYGSYETDDSDCRSYVTYWRTSVDVPYDDFDRAIVTTVTTECMDVVPTTSVVKYWFGKDTGLVKLFDDDGDTWWLEDRY